jgi:hypothetical protein
MKVSPSGDARQSTSLANVSSVSKRHFHLLTYRPTARRFGDGESRSARRSLEWFRVFHGCHMLLFHDIAAACHGCGGTRLYERRAARPSRGYLGSGASASSSMLDEPRRRTMRRLKTWTLVLAILAVPAVALAGSCPCGDDCPCSPCHCNH